MHIYERELQLYKEFIRRGVYGTDGIAPLGTCMDTIYRHSLEWDLNLKPSNFRGISPRSLLWQINGTALTYFHAYQLKKASPETTNVIILLH